MRSSASTSTSAAPIARTGSPSPPLSAPDTWPSMGIVLPVYNEAATIERALHDVAGVARRYPARARVIAVDDGSADDSWAILERVAGEVDVLDVQRHAVNSGY